MPEEVTDIPCEKCGAMMVVKTGRYGKFWPAQIIRNVKHKAADRGHWCALPKMWEKGYKEKSKKGKVFFGGRGISGL